MIKKLIRLANELDKIGFILDADKVDRIIKTSSHKKWEWNDDLLEWEIVEPLKKEPYKRKAVKLLDVYNAILNDPVGLSLLKECCVAWDDYYRKALTTEERVLKRQALYSNTMKVLQDWIIERFGEAKNIDEGNSHILAMCDVYTSQDDKYPRNLTGRNWRDEELVYDGDK